MNVYSFLYKLLDKYKILLFLSFFSALLFSLEIPLKPFFIKYLLDKIAITLPGNVFQELSIPLLLYCSITFFAIAFYRVWDYVFCIKLVPQLRNSISHLVLGHLFGLEYSFYQHSLPGSTAARLQDLIKYTPELIEILIGGFFSYIISFSFLAITLFKTHSTFCIITAVWILLFMIMLIMSSRYSEKVINDMSTTMAYIHGIMVDIFTNILTVRLFNGSKNELSNSKRLYDDSAKVEQKMQWTFLYMWTGFSALFLAAQVANLYFLLLYRSQDIISVGDFGLVLSANMTSVTLLLFVMKEYVQFNKRWGQVSGALKALFATPYKNEIVHEANLHVSAGEIIFNNVSFAYVPDQPLFCDLNVTIKPAEKVALVGYSGSGKTTFFHLLLGLYEIQGGEILIDKQNINMVTKSSLYDAISIIPQEAGLFFRSIRENICYGSSNINEKFMIESSKRAHAHEFICQLQDGYDTCLDENGIRLSGGQKQRIAIARALYKNAPLLFLDEATSQLDTLSEQFVQDGIQQAMKGKTVLVIAHRLSTLLAMERILVFEGGKIVQDGAHSELLAQEGLYKTLWNAQSNGKILDDEELN